MGSFNMGKYTCRHYGCLCATCLERCGEHKNCDNNCENCTPELQLDFVDKNRGHGGVSKCEKYFENVQTEEYIDRCVHKYHLCTDCIFSKIFGQWKITKAQGMCKLRTIPGYPFDDEGITKAEAYQMLRDLPSKERGKYII